MLPGRSRLLQDGRQPHGQRFGFVQRRWRSCRPVGDLRQGAASAHQQVRSQLGPGSRAADCRMVVIVVVRPEPTAGDHEEAVQGYPHRFDGSRR